MAPGQVLGKPVDPAHAGEVWLRLAPWLPERGDPAAALTPWTEVDPLRPFRHPMGPEARPVRAWANTRRPDLPR
ncbi:hypothetical protein ACFRMN_27560 [Streptomyces sp. NPDC056835]|uniref:hypothetical protein n=1 Tax=Streptomyces sp. NPDC056835 TaxID=3345956 RepID=UPI003692AD98